MLRAPQSAVRLPVEGMTGWGDIAGQLGSSMASVLGTAAEFAGMRERVQAGGELAAFSEKLHKIGAEVARELDEQEVDDWEYSWNAAADGRLQEAVDSLPWSARKAGAELAAAYSERASLQARRKRDLQKVNHAREQWQLRVKQAVQAGDAERAAAWLDSGAGIFVPYEQLEEQKRLSADKACLAKWQKALNASPMQALVAYAAAEKEDLPSREEDRSELREFARLQRVELRKRWAQALASGESVADDEWTNAVAAGVLSQTEAESARGIPQSLSTASLCEWKQRIGESTTDDATITELLMQMGTTPMTIENRKTLMDYVRLSSRVQEDDRRTLMRCLGDLYSNGFFGCPSDSFAQERLLTLQTSGLNLLNDNGAQAAADWLQSLQESGDTWITLSDLN